MKATTYLFVTLAISLTLFSSSCTRYKNLVMMQPTDKEQDIYNATPPNYYIQKRDILLIRIFSQNQEITQLINATNTTTGNQFTNEATLYIYGYDVNDSGYVEMPVIGKVKVAGKTLEQAKMAISEQTATILTDAVVILKLISFKYSVIGEVKNPGVYQNYNNQLTVLEALSNAGDISAYGDRRKILVIRPGENGTKTFRIDLTSTDILDSEGFFLLPNDIVYAEPVRSYNSRVNLPVLSVFLTGISTLILVLNYIDNN